MKTFKNDDPELQTMCENFKNLRLQRNLSIRELSRQAKVSVYMLNSLEQGTVPPRFGVNAFLRLCTIYQIPPAKIYRPL